MQNTGFPEFSRDGFIGINIRGCLIDINVYQTKLIHSFQLNILLIGTDLYIDIPSLRHKVVTKFSVNETMQVALSRPI